MIRNAGSYSTISSKRLSQVAESNRVNPIIAPSVVERKKLLRCGVVIACYMCRQIKNNPDISWSKLEKKEIKK